MVSAPLDEWSHCGALSFASEFDSFQSTGYHQDWFREQQHKYWTIEPQSISCSVCTFRTWRGAADAVEMDAAYFNSSVCNVVSMIPLQKITSCGHIAQLLGEPSKARRVNEIIKFLGQTCSTLPWHRVISTCGIIAHHGGLGHVQATALEDEGVSILTGSYGESRVDFDEAGWFPSQLLVVSEIDSDDEWGA